MTLYFVSNRPGGKGGMDIWKSTLTESGTWGEPVNLGDSINTPGEEMSPFIHPDNSTLYFSSDGHIGLGAQDIYVAKLKSDKTWGTPVNLGYPINTLIRLQPSIFKWRMDLKLVISMWSMWLPILLYILVWR
jgi:Tol biopolymer transport system component